uniref:G-protein coupled receptors family 1 profile domain-containing protein n=1 Tax=Biomphalaria glabrata TaxID=6526 RepID=A0A2C9KNU2_BIOGL
MEMRNSTMETSITTNNSMETSITTNSSIAVHYVVGIVSDGAKEAIVIINHVVLSSAIGLFGLGANVINMCVFVKQGLNNSMNVSFFATAVSDLCSLATLLWLNVCLNPFIDNLELPVVFTEVQYLSAGWPHGCAARITSWITAYITAERCLSIVFPLKIKQMINAKRTTVIIIIIFVINTLSLVPEYATVYFDWNWYPTKNKTLLGLAFRANRPAAEGLVFTFHASLAIVSFVAVVVFTSALVIRLRSTAEWRKTSTFDPKQTDNTTARDRKTMTMVILVATNLIVCYTPTVSFSIASSLLPDFTVVGKQHNLFHSAWSFAFLFHSINCSINIFFYYKMSSKYRANLKNLFCRGK